MRFLRSYGVALAIILLIGAWMIGGDFVQGGKGPGEGERPLVGATAPTSVSEEQQALLDEVETRRKEADAAQAAAEKAQQDVEKAVETANAASKEETDRREALKLEAEELEKAALEAKTAAQEAEKAYHEAEEHAEEAKELYDSFKTIAERNASAVGDESSTPRSVRIRTFELKQMPLEVVLRGRTEATSIVPVVSQTNAVVESVHVAKGQKVSAGELLCELDVSTRAASVAQAKANLTKAQLDFDSNAELRAKGFSSDNSGAQMQFALEAAKAALAQAEAELDRTKITSPIDGIVQGPVTSVGKLLSVGAPCVSVVALDPIKFIAAIPEARVSLARTGLPVAIETVSGQTASGEVTYVSSTADSATRSFEVEVEAGNPGNAIRDGMTAEATVNMGVLPAHLLPQSVLTLDDDGVLGVRAVVDSKVVFHEVTILKDTREGIWVSGLPAKVDVITIGHENVRVGQLVDARAAGQGASS